MLEAPGHPIARFFDKTQCGRSRLKAVRAALDLIAVYLFGLDNTAGSRSLLENDRLDTELLQSPCTGQAADTGANNDHIGHESSLIVGAVCEPAAF